MERIVEAMARAERVACQPGEGRCYAFPDPVEQARASCTPKGRCRIGWIVSHGGAGELGRLARPAHWRGALAAPERLKRHSPKSLPSIRRSGHGNAAAA